MSLASARERTQRRRQSAALDADRGNTACQSARAIDRTVDERHDFLGVCTPALAFSRLSRPTRLRQHQRHTGELLAQAVVQIAADAPLLAVGDVDDLALELAPLRDVFEHHQAMLLRRRSGSG